MSEPPTKIQKITKITGAKGFKRSNPRTDLFEIQKFHHLEIYCHDATNTARRWSGGLGMRMVARSDIQTGNHDYCSYALNCNDLTLVFTAPYRTSLKPAESSALQKTFPKFSFDKAMSMLGEHGMFVRTICLQVADAEKAYKIAVDNGGRSALEPITLEDDEELPGKTKGKITYAEVELYGDTVIRFLSGRTTGPFMPGYARAEPRDPINYGLTRIDHVVGNVPHLLDAVNYIRSWTGFHEFAEFTAEDVGTVDSGLNSMVLASNNEAVLLPINEPTHGTKRKSQIQTYLDHHNAPGVQHIAIKTNDIFWTLTEMRRSSPFGGFEFMPKPDDAYYKRLRVRLGDDLTEDQYILCQKYGVLGDKDDQGTLLQIFTRPVLDRPTLFLEIIQRVGCMVDKEQLPGCGGFGKGNFGQLFKSIEDFEKQLEGEIKVDHANA
eukprot:TRINITY_DN75133_c0_g1_i1.p1 TRINITY_DN75133_c0_g1~~TRINITY_DN75133_c0_g1_i1.p1  ORF type:complete len:444 (-),score=62.92 TRINITY_DN75133_c0_g1_i1:233-1540(-)